MEFLDKTFGAYMPPETEAEWRDAARIRLLPFLKALLSLGSLIHLSFSVWDYYVAPDLFWQLFAIRLASVLFPFMLLVSLYFVKDLEKRSVLILNIAIINYIAATALILVLIDDGFSKGLTGNLFPFLVMTVIPYYRPLITTALISAAILLYGMYISGVPQYEYFQMAPFILAMAIAAITIGTVFIINNKKSFLLERGLHEAKLAAEQADRAKSSFLATMSHEVRTPLNGVLGVVSLLEDTPLSSKQFRYLETIRYSGEALLTILNDILDFSKLEAGKLSIEIMDVDLPKLVQSVIELMQSRASENGVIIESYIDADVPLYIKSDPTRLRQVLINLVSNAVKFSEDSSIDIYVKKIDGDDDNVTLRFEVVDHGIGISQEAQANLFQEFSQADASTSRKYGGTGLGLSICQKIIQLLGGEINVYSKLGEGSTFWFTVPAELAENAADEDEGHGSGSTYVVTKPLNILLAEDNKVNQQVAIGFLEKLNHKVTLAQHGAEAVEQVENNDFDIILMDMQMPVMDGLQATRKIKSMVSRKKEIPIIALTANALKGDDERCMAAGMVDHVGKPINKTQLYNALARHAPKHLRNDSSEQKTASASSNEDAAANDHKARIDVMQIKELEKLFGKEKARDFLRDNLPELSVHFEKLLANRDDMKQAFHHSHDVKSLSRMFGLVELSSIAEAIEIASNSGEKEEVNDLIERLKENFQANVEELREMYSLKDVA